MIDHPLRKACDKLDIEGVSTDSFRRTALTLKVSSKKYKRMVSQTIAQTKIAESGIQILGSVLDKFNQKDIEKEIQKIDTLPSVFPYPEYIVGHRTMYPLWNQSGDINDANICHYEGISKITRIGTELSHIREVLTNTFYLEHLKVARINKHFSGLFGFAHRDYSDNQAKTESFYTRIHIPIKTQMGCWHAYNSELYHMDYGEIWLHDGSIVHAPCNFSSETRLHILLDFDYEVPLENLFRDKSVLSPSYPIDEANRDTFHEKDLEQILRLSEIVNSYNFKDIAGIVGKVPFKKKVNCALSYDWLIEIAKRSGNAELIEKSKMVKFFFVGRTNSATASKLGTVPQFRFF